ncbi:hypothetical protein GCM10010116_33450 [Microbispora rosea subsp. aerata]|nr:ABC transporter substrate-binding protein [Microbispora rosea]GGO16601.1 hypothetical protein GCM10010116_33450 [Microbispora rosea subsp. aerata]GIH56043.1 hypothetical protein Mro02_29570 [Microbispora rosea subsp. aerata]GLJ86644.1 hypothetical protein GCM10017588_53820 [Microbispora rosea subsp. aerata]
MPCVLRCAPFACLSSGDLRSFVPCPAPRGGGHGVPGRKNDAFPPQAVASLLKDAGGTYAWADTKGTGSTALDLETVLSKAGDAPTWLVVENNWKSLADVEKADARYAKFKAFQDGNVWSANKVLGPGGGNDYYERGVARPDLILADLIAILRPELAPGHELTFYQRLTK